jgi:hypothetical protein
VGNFERRTHVVVEPSHQTRPDFVADLPVVQVLTHPPEVFAARLVQVIENGRKRFNDRLIFGYFAIEHAQRIHFRAPLAIGAHARRHIL